MARSNLKKNQNLSNAKTAKASAGNSAQNSGAERHSTVKKTAGKREDSAEEQRGMILSMFFDEDNDADGFLALVKHCKIDLAACNGDVKQAPNVIAAHYRLKRGKYDIDRAANDLRTFPPIAARIEELKAKKLASGFGQRR